MAYKNAAYMDESIIDVCQNEASAAGDKLKDYLQGFTL